MAFALDGNPTLYDTEERRSALSNAMADLAEYYISPSNIALDETAIAEFGLSSTVRRAVLHSKEKTQSERIVAVKTLQWADDSLRIPLRTLRELQVWRQLNHPNILTLVGFYMDEASKALWIVSPWMSNGSIRRRLDLGEITFNTRLGWVDDITAGLHYLHMELDSPVIHGSLNSNNVLLTNEQKAVLADFGLSVIRADQHETGLTTSSGFKGSVRWSSPEELDGYGVTREGDIWSWALTALEVMTGRLPFYRQNNEYSVIRRISSGRPPTPDEYPELEESHHLWKTLARCWMLEPSERPNVSECRHEIRILVQAAAAELQIPVPPPWTPAAPRRSTPSPPPIIVSSPPEPSITTLGTHSTTDISSILEVALEEMSPHRIKRPKPSFVSKIMKIILPQALARHAPGFGKIVVQDVIINHDDDNVQRDALFFALEAKIRSVVQHLNIAKFNGFDYDEDLRVGCFIQERYSKGTMRDAMLDGRYKLTDRLGWLRDTTAALLYLHKQRTPPIIHGDLRPENLFLNDYGEAILGNFHASARAEATRLLQRGRSEVVPGDIRFCSPELLEYKQLRTSADIWAWGSLALEVLSHLAPYYFERDPQEVMKCILKGQLPNRREHDSHELSRIPWMWSLLDWCWIYDPQKRAGIELCNSVLLSMVRPNTGNPVRHAGRQGSVPTPAGNLRTTYDTEERRKDLNDLTHSLRSIEIDRSRLHFDENEVGRGGFGRVRRALLANKGANPPLQFTLEKVAVKEPLSRNYGFIRLAMRFARELEVWSQLEHPNVLKLIGFYIDQETELAYMISPYLPRGNIVSRIADKSTEKSTRMKWLRDTTEGLHYLHMHSEHVVHGDLKAANVLLDDTENAVLCDFGLASATEVQRRPHNFHTSGERVGTFAWCSPEVLDGGQPTTQSDMWAWALLGLEIMTGRRPYHTSKSLVQITKRVSEGGPSHEDYPELEAGDPLWGVLDRCWEKKPSTRATIAECRAAILGMVRRTG